MALRLRSASVVSHFKLPSTEILIDTFTCSVSRSYLHSGRAYLTHNYLCFYSKTYGETKEILRLRDIVSIIKRNRFVIGIEIITKTYDRVLFSAFEDRNKAFALIAATWRNNIGAEDAAKHAAAAAAAANSPQSSSASLSSASSSSSIAGTPGNDAAGGGSVFSIDSLINNEPLANSPLHYADVKQTQTVHATLNAITPRAGLLLVLRRRPAAL